MVELVNPQTGELHLVGIVKKPRHKLPFVCLFQEELLTVVKTAGRDLSGGEWLVLCLVMATIPFGNVTEQYVTEMAEQLGNDRSTTSRALAVLQAHQLIHRTPGKGRRPAKVMLDPRLAFRGNVRERCKAMNSEWPWPEQRPRPIKSDPAGA